MMPTTKDAKKPVISARNAELDSKMGGGLPTSSLCLIEGVSGAGKSVLTQQIIRGALEDGFLVSLFTTENSVKSLVSQMRSIDLDILDFLLLRKFRAYPVELSRLGDAAPFELLQAMIWEHGRDILVVDSFTSAITHVGDEARTLGFFEECKRLCAAGLTIIITLHPEVVDDDLISAMRSMCDANLRLHTQQDGQRLVKTLEVAKIRGAASVTGAIVGFEVEPGWGMRIIPISKARG
jgi:archaeal flagellar protein FlaH